METTSKQSEPVEMTVEPFGRILRLVIHPGASAQGLTILCPKDPGDKPCVVTLERYCAVGRNVTVDLTWSKRVITREGIPEYETRYEPSVRAESLTIGAMATVANGVTLYAGEDLFMADILGPDKKHMYDARNAVHRTSASALEHKFWEQPSTNSSLQTCLQLWRHQKFAKAMHVHLEPDVAEKALDELSSTEIPALAAVLKLCGDTLSVSHFGTNASDFTEACKALVKNEKRALLTNVSFNPAIEPDIEVPATLASRTGFVRTETIQIECEEELEELKKTEESMLGPDVILLDSFDTQERFALGAAKTAVVLRLSKLKSLGLRPRESDFLVKDDGHGFCAIKPLCLSPGK